MTHTKTKQQPKLSVIRKGVWRTRWLVHKDIAHTDGCQTPRGEHFWGRHPSKEVADEVANKWLQASRKIGSPMQHITYLGPVFFPEEGEQ